MAFLKYLVQIFVRILFCIVSGSYHTNHLGCCAKSTNLIVVIKTIKTWLLKLFCVYVYKNGWRMQNCVLNFKKLSFLTDYFTIFILSRFRSDEIFVKFLEGLIFKEAWCFNQWKFFNSHSENVIKNVICLHFLSSSQQEIQEEGDDQIRFAKM